MRMRIMAARAAQSKMRPYHNLHATTNISYFSDLDNFDIDYGYSGGLAPLNPPAARGEHIWIQIWQYIPIYPAIIPIYALLSDTLGVLGSDLSGAPPGPPMGQRDRVKGTHFSDLEIFCNYP